ncbi:MAG TPA: hypothetical protein VFG59_04935 [Anaeromyxobacter sp.]|nr:hypothetical protein [Anaeromyxobacter sp.]
MSLWPVAWAIGKSGTPASTCQLANVRRRSLGLQRSFLALAHASARSRRTFLHD